MLREQLQHMYGRPMHQARMLLEKIKRLLYTNTKNPENHQTNLYIHCSDSSNIYIIFCRCRTKIHAFVMFIDLLSANSISFNDQKTIHSLLAFPNGPIEFLFNQKLNSSFLRDQRPTSIFPNCLKFCNFLCQGWQLLRQCLPCSPFSL